MKKRILNTGWIVWPLLATMVNTLIIPPTSLFAAGELSFAGPTGSPVPTVAVCTSGAGCNLQTNGFVEPSGPTTLQNTQTFLSQNGLQAATITAIPNENKEESNGIYYMQKNAEDKSILSFGDISKTNSVQNVDLYSGDPVSAFAVPENFEKGSGKFSVSPNGAYGVTLSNSSLYNSQFNSYSTTVSLYDSKTPPAMTSINFDVSTSFKMDSVAATDKGGFLIVKRNVSGYGSPSFAIDFYTSPNQMATGFAGNGSVPLISGGSTPAMYVKSWNLALEGNSVDGYKLYMYGVSTDSTVVHVVVLNMSADCSKIDQQASNYYSIAYTGGTVEKIAGQDIFLMTGDPNAFIATSDRVSMTLIDPANGQKDTFAILAKKNSSGGSDPVIIVSHAGNTPPAQIKALNSYLHNYINAYGISYTNPKFTVLGFTPTDKGSVAIKFEVVEANNPSKKGIYILPAKIDALLTGLGFVNLPKYYPSTVFTAAAVKYKNVKTEAKSNAVSIIVEEINGLPEGNSTVVARVKDSAGNIVQSIARDVNVGKHQMDNIRGGYIEDPASFIIEGLNPGQTYTYELIAYDAKGVRINNLGVVTGYSNTGTFYTNQFSNIKVSAGAVNNDVKMTFTLEGLPIRNSPTNDVTVYFEIWHPNGYLVASVSKVVRNTTTATQPGPITDSLTIPNISGGLGYNYVLRTASNFANYYQKNQGYFWMPSAGQPGIDFSPNINSPRPVMMLSPMAVGGSLQFVMGNGRMLDYTDKKAVLVNVDNQLNATLLSFNGTELIQSVNVSPNGRYVAILYTDSLNRVHRYVYDTFRNVRQEDTILAVSGFSPSSLVIDDQSRIFIVGTNSANLTSQVVVYKNGQLLGQIQFNYASKNVLNQIALRNEQELLLYGVDSGVLSTQVIGISDMGAQWKLTPMGITQSRAVQGNAPEYLGIRDGVELIRMKYPKEEIIAVGDYGQLSLASMSNMLQSSWAFNSIKTTYDPMGRVWSVNEFNLSLYDPSTDTLINTIPTTQLLQNLGLNTDPTKVYYFKSITIKEELVPRSVSGEKVNIYALDLIVFDSSFGGSQSYQVNGRLEELYSYGFGISMTPLNGKVRFRDVNLKLDPNMVPPKGSVDFLTSGIPTAMTAGVEVVLYESPSGLAVETVTPALDVNGRWVANFTKLKFGTNFTYKIRTTAASAIKNQESYMGEFRVPLQKTVAFSPANVVWRSSNSIYAEFPLSGIPTGTTPTSVTIEVRDPSGNLVYKGSQNVTSADSKVAFPNLSTFLPATSYTYSLTALYKGERIEKQTGTGTLSTEWDVMLPNMTYVLQGNNLVFNIPSVNGLGLTASQLTVEVLNGPQTAVLTSGSVAVSPTNNLNLVVTVPTTGLQTGVQYATRVRIDRNTAPVLPNVYTVPYTTPNVSLTPADTTPPVLSAVSLTNVTNTGATIAWTTNEASTTQIEYGLTTSYGSSTTLDASLVNSHSQLLSGLTQNTLYHYRLKSKDAAGNQVVSQDYTFTTSAIVGTTAVATIQNFVQRADSVTFSLAGTGFAPNSWNYIHFVKVGPPDQVVSTYSFQVNASGAPNPATFYTLDRLASSSYVIKILDSRNTAVPAGERNVWPYINDTTPPVVSAVSAGSLTSSGVTISWTTNEGSTTQILYGTAFPLAASTTMNSSLITSHSQMITGLSSGTTYYYQVRSLDSMGNLGSSGTLAFTTTGAPDTTAPLISAVGASNLTSNGATITWSTNEASDTQIEYGTTTAYGSSTTLSTAMVTSHSQAISGLNANTVYNYRVKSKDSAGNLIVSGNFTFTTPSAPDTTAPVITVLPSSSNVTSSGATIAWTTNEASDTQIEYGLTTSYGSSTPLNTAMVTSHSQTISGLNANTVYNYRVKSKDAAGNLVVSGNFTFTTPSAPDTTAPVITVLPSSSNVTSAGATINWTTNEASDTQIEYGLTTAYGSSTTLNTAMVTSHSQAISGLNANTVYNYRVKSKDSAGNLIVSGNFTFTTPSAPDTTAPVITVLPSSSNVTSSGATINWTTNEASDTQIEYGLSSSFGSSTTLNTVMLTSHSQAISGLNANTLYYYRVKSKDAAGNLVTSAAYTFTTQTTTPTTQQGTAQVASVNATSTTVSFTISGSGFLPNSWSYIHLVKTGVVPEVVTSSNSILANASGVISGTYTYSREAAAGYEIRVLDGRTYPAPIVSRYTVAPFGSAPDTTAPVITVLPSSSNVTSAGATINWTTSEASDTQIEYGLSSSFGSSTTVNSAMLTSHSQTISGLNANTIYYYRVKSRDAAGNIVVSSNYTFTTPPAAQMSIAGSIGNLATNSAVVNITGMNVTTNQSLILTLNKKVNGVYVFDRNVTVTLPAGSSTSAVAQLNNLSMGTEYQVVMPAGVTMPVTTFTTLTASPRVQGAVASKTSTSIKYTLTPQNIPAGVSLSATLYDFTAGKFVQFQWPGTSISTSGASTVEFTGLIPGRQYGFDVHDSTTGMSYYNNIFTA